MFHLSNLRALAFCAFLGARMEAAVLVVDQNSSHASDKNPGTKEQPLKTISAAATKAHAGDKVIIHGGDYRETVTITTSGSEKAPIVFEAPPGETPVIKGSDRMSQWTLEEGSVWKAKLRVPAPRGSDGKIPSFWETNDVRQVFTRDGALFDARRLQRVTNRGAMKAGTFFCDHAASMLYAWLPDSSSPVEHPPEASVRGAWLNVYADHVIIRGLQMRHASTTAIANWPACNLKGNDVTLEKCTITWGDFVGVSMSGVGDSLRDCVIACNGDSGIGGTGERHLIEGCRVVYNNLDRYSPRMACGWSEIDSDFSPRHDPA